RRPRQRLQRLHHLVGVVGQRVEILALDDDGARVLVRLQREGRRPFLDVDGLLDRSELEADVHGDVAAARDRHRLALVRPETLLRDRDHVGSRREVRDAVLALGVGADGLAAGRTGDPHVGVGNPAARGVRDAAVDARRRGFLGAYRDRGGRPDEEREDERAPPGDDLHGMPRPRSNRSDGRPISGPRAARPGRAGGWRASRPLTSAIAFAWPGSAPFALETRTRSPFFSSASVAGVRRSIRSSGPPPGPHAPRDQPPAPRPWRSGSPAPAERGRSASSDGVEKRRRRAAISGGKRRTRASTPTLTTTVRRVSSSRSVTSPLAVSTAVTVPTSVRNVPNTTCSARTRAPSGVRSPRARSWSPVCTSASVLGRASANFTESAAQRRNPPG